MRGIRRRAGLRIGEFSIVIGLITVLGLSFPAHAITFGTVDTVHTFVGAWVAMDTDGTVRGCSGSLVSSRVFLTAGHCIPAFFATVSLDQMFVTFAVDRRDRSAWLPVAAFMTDPLFTDGLPGNGPHFDDPHDLAVVILANPVTDVAPGMLAPASGYLDALAAQGGLVPLQTTFQVVGSGQDQDFQRTFTREVATEGFLDLEAAWLLNSENPTLGFGGSCIGDSGGPILFTAGTTQYIVAIVSAGDAHCRALDKGYRADTVESLAFIQGEIEDNP